MKCIWENEEFAEYRKDVGDDLDVLLDLMEFKWTLTDQIKRARSLGRVSDDWEHRVTAVVIRVQSRITEVRRALRAAGRSEEMGDALEELREERYEDGELY